MNYINYHDEIMSLHLKALVGAKHWHTKGGADTSIPVDRAMAFGANGAKARDLEANPW